MSRSTAIVLAILLGISALAWFQPWRAAPVPPPAAPAPAAPAAPAVPATDPAPPAATNRPAVPVGQPAGPVPIGSMAELAALLEARGLRPDDAIAAYREWREALGFIGPDDLTGVIAGESRLDYYRNLDTATLRNLASGGDAVAAQLVADLQLDDNVFGAIRGYREAAGLGSAQAMLAVASTLRGLAQFPADGVGIDPKLAAGLLDLRRGDPGRDLRADAMAWALAAARQYGPAAVDQSTFRWLEVQAEQLPAETVALACGQSLAIMAELNAQGAPRSSLPPVLTGEADFYARLPCGDSPVPVTPPPELARCETIAARNRFGQPFAVWTCPGN
jgi:hypothetical protein